jgi:ParB-like chromosome segregation protein Spo0J
MFEHVSLQDIDTGNETFRVSEELDSAPLRQSLAEVGQIHPLTLAAAGGGGLTVVAGFRRFVAIRSLGGKSVLARICGPDSQSALQLFRPALWENLSHRTLNVLEAARALRVLNQTCGLTLEAVAREYLPAFGLAPSVEALRANLLLNDLTGRVRSMVARGLLTPRTAERLASMDQGNRECVAAVMEQVRLSASRQRQFLDLVQEGARMRGTSPAGLLSEPEVAEILSTPARSPFDKGEALFDTVFRWRHPRLTRARGEFEAVKRRLSLPPAVRLLPDPYFESPAVRVEFEASSLAEFQIRTEALASASWSPTNPGKIRQRTRCSNVSPGFPMSAFPRLKAQRKYSAGRPILFRPASVGWSWPGAAAGS